MSASFLRIASLLLLIGAIALGWYGIKQGSAVNPTVKEAPVIPVHPQVVASRPILAGQVLQHQDVKIIQVNHFNIYGFKAAHLIVGRVVRENVDKDAPILAMHFHKLSPAALSLKEGERAVAIKVDEVAGVGGYVQPGDHVDVLLFAHDDRDMKRNSVAQVVLSDLRVISFGDSIDDNTEKVDEPVNNNSVLGKSLLTTDGGIKSEANTKPNSSSKSAVLAVKVADATKLMLAANIGQLRLALRGDEVALIDADDALQTANMNGSYFIKNDALLVGSPEKQVANIANKQVQSKPKVSGQSVVIVHHGDDVKIVKTKVGK